MQKGIVVLCMIIALVGCDSFSSKSKFVEEVHYQTFEGSSAASQSSQSITEVFWYGCPHCKAFAPLISKWAVQNEDTKVVYLPIVKDEKSELHAKVFYLIESRENFAQLHTKMFELIGSFHRTMSVGEQQVEIIKALNELGISPMETAKAIQSEEFDEKLIASLNVIKKYQVKSVPTLIVNDQYKVLNSGLTDLKSILKVADHLLAL